jgi:hypothetical protein
MAASAVVFKPQRSLSNAAEDAEKGYQLVFEMAG